MELQESAKVASPAMVAEVLIGAVERLERLIDRETAMLIRHEPVTFDDFNRGKRHGLLELRRAISASRELDRGALGQDPKAVLARLRSKLQVNLMVLQTHFDAAAAIASVIAQTIEDHESDGTYTPDAARKGKP
ncbi:MAG: hypothetical protein L0Y60_11960 [Beijerinckiaceae bacterium]|nr:hypothetical protein [Beijerinckiaceae bacterium]